MTQKKRAGINAAAWFYAQPGFHELPDSPRHGDYGHVCNEACIGCSEGWPLYGRAPYRAHSYPKDYKGLRAGAYFCTANQDSSPGACGPERAQCGDEAQQAPDGSGHADKALVALQAALNSHNEENPWLGVCAAVALLLLDQGSVPMKTAYQLAKEKPIKTYSEMRTIWEKESGIREALELLDRVAESREPNCDQAHPSPCDCVGNAICAFLALHPYGSR